MGLSVVIRTGSRLHFGPFAYGTGSPPFFGGVGVMLDSPGFGVEMERCAVSEQDAISVSDAVCGTELAGRVEGLLERYRDGKTGGTSFRLLVHEVIPSHIGLGSGTQLGLAVAVGAALLEEKITVEKTSVEKTTSTVEGKKTVAVNGLELQRLALRVGRGRQSAIGIHGFREGGFLVDAGKASEESVGVLAGRCDVPHDWRFVLVTPGDEAGLSGTDEVTAFSLLPTMPRAVTDSLCEITLRHWLPAVRSADFSLFSESMFRFGETVGNYFSPVQGNCFRHPQMQQLAVELRQQGIAGVAQSSWGPTIAIAMPNANSARQLSADLATNSLCENCGVRVASPRNCGAGIVVSG